jgi:hypothetical protein
VGADSLDEVAARLYALTPEEFTGARDEAVARARAGGDRAGAAAIAKLRKPTVGAWLVNLLAHERPDLVGDLLALGDSLRAAQRHLRGDELRELSQRRRETVSALAREAGVLGRRHARGNLPLAEVEATLTAALAEPEVAELVRAGRLTRTVTYAGFGEAPRPQLRLVQGGRTETDNPAARRAEEEHRAAEAQRRAAERAAEEERIAAARAAERQEQERRRRERAAAHRELLAARTELAEAEAARTLAERAVTAARRRVEKADAGINALDAQDQ